MSETQTQQIAGTLRRSAFQFYRGLVVLLACVGIYGVISYSVNRRTHEVGIRMGLGAERRGVPKMAAGQGLRLVLIGMSVAIVGVLAFMLFLASLLYGVKPTGPLTFIAVSLILIAVPCWRATSPSAALPKSTL